MRTMALLALSRPPVRGRTGSERDLAHLSDEALVALLARGDEGALAELYDRFGAVAYGLALRVVRDAALAEDADLNKAEGGRGKVECGLKNNPRPSAFRLPPSPFQ